MDDWYSHIELEIRGLVKLLRDQGINTFSSCGHKLEIEAEIYADNELKVVDTILYNAGYRDYVITAYIRRCKGNLAQQVAVIKLLGGDNGD